MSASPGLRTALCNENIWRGGAALWLDVGSESPKFDGCDSFNSFKTFNRYAPFKSFNDNC